MDSNHPYLFLCYCYHSKAKEGIPWASERHLAIHEPMHWAAEKPPAIHEPKCCAISPCPTVRMSDFLSRC